MSDLRIWHLVAESSQSAWADVLLRSPYTGGIAALAVDMFLGNGKWAIRTGIKDMCEARSSVRGMLRVGRIGGMYEVYGDEVAELAV